MLTAVHSCSWERADKVFPDINFQIDTSYTHPEEIARRVPALPFKGECPGHGASAGVNVVLFCIWACP